jgi:hypothetical protein
LNSHRYFYHEIPKYYVWVNKTKEWSARQRLSKNIVGRMYTVHPRDVERYCLRLLLLNVKGVTTYDALRSYRGCKIPTFKAVVQARGLLENDDEWDQCIIEASNYDTSIHD